MKKAAILPRISIIMPTLNNAHETPLFIESIKNQNYPKDKIEILWIDGGSKDKTVEIAKKNNIKVIPNPQVLAEPGVSIGMENATGDLMMVLAMDNIFTDPDAFQKIAKVFEDPDIYAAFPKQNYDHTDNILTRYHNTFTDPFNHFINGYAANARTFHRVYKTLIHNDIYDVYDFAASDVVPMISFSQGFTIRRDYRRKDDDFLDDCTPIIDLIERNKKIAYIHSLSIYHHTINNLAHFMKKQRWATQNALTGKKYGVAFRYQKLSPSQKIKMIVWPIYAFSFIFPLIRGLYGAIRDKELLWLFHPINCFLSAYASATQVITYKLNNSATISRQ